MFKSSAFSKSFFILIPDNNIEELEHIQKRFLWSNKKIRIEHDTLCNNYKNGGLKSVNIVHEINVLKCS